MSAEYLRAQEEARRSSTLSISDLKRLNVLEWTIEQAYRSAFQAEAVSCYEVNRGTPSAFWQVVCRATPVNPVSCEGRGWRYGTWSAQPAFSGKFTMDRKLTEAQGSICPAHWRSSSY